MTDRLPYEEQIAQQLNDLPLPDENMAWADMKRRLEEDDDDGIIPIWLRGCGLWALLAIVLVGIGWWLIRPEKWWNKKQETESVTTIQSKENTIDNSKNSNDTSHLIKNSTEEIKTSNKPDTSKNLTPGSSSDSLVKEEEKHLIKAKDNIVISGEGPQSKKKKTGDGKETKQRTFHFPKRFVQKKKNNPATNDQGDISIQPVVKNKDSLHVAEKNKQVIPFNDSSNLTKIPVSKPDSVAKKTLPDSTIKKTSQAKKDSSKSKSISFSAGLGMHQLLPIDGQKLTPYNSAGRKGSLGDYIPSVFGRMYRNDKWFLQLEFRYGAPQSTKEFLYQQKSKSDTIQGAVTTTTTSSRLKKTFYHQLPLTFNYFVLPNWSIGTGLVWNKFVSAASQQEVNRRNNSSQQDSLLSSGLIIDKNDSIFKKSYFQAVFETQYRWRRFFLGVRYSFGLQPYIVFTLPGGTQQRERNKSLQVFLRYELWKSKAKK